MQSTTTSVDAYMAELPPERSAAIHKLRELCQKYLVNHEEGMAYGMPTYWRNGASEVAFASQKNYISLYITREEAQAVGKPQLEGKKGINCGKGCFRYTKPENIDYSVVEEMLKTTAALG